MIALPTPDTPSFGPSVYLTLANLSHKGKVTAVAYENYRKALLEDPWSWESFTGLCDLGATYPILLDRNRGRVLMNRLSTRTRRYLSRPPYSSSSFLLSTFFVSPTYSIAQPDAS
jgi:hypothetical protein